MKPCKLLAAKDFGMCGKNVKLTELHENIDNVKYVYFSICFSGMCFHMGNRGLMHQKTNLM
jgi:hypothetical protein